MESLNKKTDNLFAFKHGTFQLHSSETKNDYHSIKYQQQEINRQLIVKIKSQLIEGDNYYLLLKGATLMLFISEKKEIGEPLYVHHLKKSALASTGYEKLRCCEYQLPQDGYSIKRAKWNSYTKNLKNQKNVKI